MIIITIIVITGTMTTNIIITIIVITGTMTTNIIITIIVITGTMTTNIMITITCQIKNMKRKKIQKFHNSCLVTYVFCTDLSLMQADSANSVSVKIIYQFPYLNSKNNVYDFLYPPVSII